MTSGSTPTRPLHILAADADPVVRANYRDALTALGHQVCLAESGRQVLDLCRTVNPDLVITADRLADTGGFDLAARLCADHRPLPVIVAADEALAAGAWATAGCQVMGYLVKPFRADALAAAVATAARCFDQIAAAREEAAQLRQTLDERKLIERAKGAVVRYCGLDEDEAYRRLRRMATDSNRKMIDVAREVQAAADVFARMADDGHKPPRGPNGAPRRDRLPVAAGRE